MRILHIVTLVSKDGAFGGPSQVAITQSAALRGAGQNVLLISTGRGHRLGDSAIGGARVRLFGSVNLWPRSSFAGTSSIGLLTWLVVNLRRFDLVHLHLARDLVMIPSALIVWLSRKPYVVQPHGMIEPSGGRLAAVLDSIATRRVLRSARVVFALGVREKKSLRAVARTSVDPRILPNGLTPITERDLGTRVGRQVLFLARLHERKRPTAFVRMAILLAPRFPDVMFYLVGPDEGEATHVIDLIRGAGLEQQILLQPPVSPSVVRRRMSESLVYVLPARDEPFGLTVLEALSVGVPVVLSKSGGLARTVEEAGAGVAVDDSVQSLVEGVAQLLDSEDLRTEMGANGRRLVEELFSIDRVVNDLLAAYSSSAVSLPPDRVSTR